MIFVMTESERDMTIHKRAKMIIHKCICNCYGKFGLLTKNLVYLVCSAYYSSVVVQWNDFKIFFALSSNLQHTKILLGTSWQSSKLLEF